MNIVIAPDSFKGNMRSTKVCEIIREAIISVIPKAKITSIPMADGGEGTLEAVVSATGGKIETIQVSGPLGDPVEAQYGILPDGSMITEMASASGIELLNKDQLDPMQTSTYGTGELLAHLLKQGAKRIVMGIGGSATVDGGTGMAQALGYRFLDKQGKLIEEKGGKIASKIHQIDTTHISPLLNKVEILIACDVTNPLVGPSGAATVFGPQKGATPQMIKELDNGLSHLLNIVNTKQASGDGAAGGLGFALRTFCTAKIMPGAQLIAEITGLPKALKNADLLITGEGRTDEQTAGGKLCSVLGSMAREQGVRTMLLSGALQGNLSALFETFDYAFSISSGHSSLEACIKHAPADLAFTTSSAIRLLRDQV